MKKTVRADYDQYSVIFFWLPEIYVCSCRRVVKLDLHSVCFAFCVVPFLVRRFC